MKTIMGLITLFLLVGILVQVASIPDCNDPETWSTPQGVEACAVPLP